FYPDAAAMRINDVLDDGEAQASAAGFAGAGLVYAIETLEYAFQMLGCDAGAEVLNTELHFRFKRQRSNSDALATLAVLKGILNEVAENLVHRVWIGQHQRVGCARGFEV